MLYAVALVLNAFGVSSGSAGEVPTNSHKDLARAEIITFECSTF